MFSFEIYPSCLMEVSQSQKLLGQNKIMGPKRILGEKKIKGPKNLKS